MSPSTNANFDAHAKFQGRIPKQFDDGRLGKQCADPTSERNAEVLPSDYKVAAFKIVMKAGSAEEYESLLGLYAAAETNVDKKHVMCALGAAPDMELKQRTLD